MQGMRKVLLDNQKTVSGHKLQIWEQIAGVPWVIATDISNQQLSEGKGSFLWQGGRKFSSAL